ncbi:MAG: nucleotidyl transferase AbiEii/AbiGii toxin family protein [Bacteroidetes bacterium]|nr:MAG: nucleotidyl transferase AbiEii/AbiGii toxin family protein [Bacteroidota bacterium]
MKKFYDLDKSRKKTIFDQVAAREGLPSAAIEKDWWVTLALKAIFNLEFAQHIVFKGGTSLSKGWKLIDRFSEDIDLAIDRRFFNFEGDLSKGQIRKLRNKSCKFISNDFSVYLKDEISDIGIKDFDLKVRPFVASDTDPVIIELHYKSLTEPSGYITPNVLVEIGSRALKEPFEQRSIQTMIGQSLPEAGFIDKPMEISLVLPKRTFLEKAFLLHEEYQRPVEKRKLERKSRHLYDLEKLMDTEHGTDALKDHDLYKSIVGHRQVFSKLNKVDYSSHNPNKINFVPSGKTLKLLEDDYKKMQESMIYGNSLSFPDLIKRLEELQGRFRKTL